MKKVAFYAMMIPGIVGITNVSIELFIGLFSEYVGKPRNYQQIIIESMYGICGIQFINLGVLFLAVSLYVDFPIFSN